LIRINATSTFTGAEKEVENSVKVFAAEDELSAPEESDWAEDWSEGLCVLPGIEPSWFKGSPVSGLLIQVTHFPPTNTCSVVEQPVKVAANPSDKARHFNFTRFLHKIVTVFAHQDQGRRRETKGKEICLRPPMKLTSIVPLQVRETINQKVTA
jgi:hypothetical protein|tara:strand:+ start:3808 stop:4269 length:462 start_codon:yes stop_codon:yes gene_type:complete